MSETIEMVGGLDWGALLAQLLTAVAFLLGVLQVLVSAVDKLHDMYAEHADNTDYLSPDREARILRALDDTRTTGEKAIDLLKRLSVLRGRK